MTDYTLTVRELFLLMGCYLLTYSQLSDNDLDSVFGVNLELRMNAINYVEKVLKENLHQGKEYRVTLHLNQSQVSVLMNFANHGSFYFDPNLVAGTKEEALNISRKLSPNDIVL